nr:formylglycine-generating enzyme family protein [Anaerolineae bacterium]
MTEDRDPVAQAGRNVLGTIIRWGIALALLAVLIWFAGPPLFQMASEWIGRQLSGETLSAAPTPTPTMPPPTPTSLPDWVEIRQNDDWTPVIDYFGGVAMAKVPPGCFMMGSHDDPDEEPPHQVCFENAYWIDVLEVTNQQYGDHGTWDEPDVPRELVTFEMALLHCMRRGARLPSEAEWEYAARGPDGLIYPWGNAFDPDLVVYGETSRDRTNAAGNHPAGASWVGAQDMSGSIWEWTSSLYMPYPYDPLDGREISFDEDSTTARVMRGGSWGSVEYLVRASARAQEDPSTASFHDGFRCARDD